MCQILKFCQIRQLHVQTVNCEPSVDTCWYDEDPNDRYKDVVGENEVIQDGEEQESEETKSGESGKAIEPRHDLLFVFLKFSMNKRGVMTVESEQKRNKTKSRTKNR